MCQSCHHLSVCCVCVLNHSSCVQIFATPWTTAHEAPLSMGFSRQEYWSGFSCPPSGLGCCYFISKTYPVGISSSFWEGLEAHQSWFPHPPKAATGVWRWLMKQSSEGYSTIYPVKPSSGPPSLPSPKGAIIQLEMLEITFSLEAALHHLPQIPWLSFGANAVSPSLHLPTRISAARGTFSNNLESLTGGRQKAHAVSDPFLHHSSRQLSRHWRKFENERAVRPSCLRWGRGSLCLRNRHASSFHHFSNPRVREKESRPEQPPTSTPGTRKASQPAAKLSKT